MAKKKIKVVRTIELPQAQLLQLEDAQWVVKRNGEVSKRHKTLYGARQAAKALKG